METKRLENGHEKWRVYIILKYTSYLKFLRRIQFLNGSCRSQGVYRKPLGAALGQLPLTNRSEDFIGHYNFLKNAKIKSEA